MAEIDDGGPAMTVPSNERLRELAAAADEAISTMTKDRDEFVLAGRSVAASHYAVVIQKQADLAAVCRALIAVREALAEARDPVDAANAVIAIVGGEDGRG